MDKLEIEHKEGDTVASSWNFIVHNSNCIQNKDRRAKFRELLQQHKEKFITMLAAKKYHHNKIGGLAVHTGQVMDMAISLFQQFRKNMPGITIENVYVVAILHDLAKTQCYKKISEGPYPFTYNDDFNVENDVWTIAEANRFGLNLSYDEMMGILQAHGGWSKIKEPNNKLATIIHCADMISSQLLKNSG